MSTLTPTDPRPPRAAKWRRMLLFGIPLLLAPFLAVQHSIAGVSLFDQLATPKRAFFLKLRTHRGPLAMGGVRGRFWIDEHEIGSVLTGVDGYGFLKYEAPTTGTFTLRARTAAGDAEARMRIIAPSAPVVLFEAEALIWRLHRLDHASSVTDMLTRIAADFELAYLCGPMSRPGMGPLIRRHVWPDAVVLVGKDRNQFERLAARGVNIFAVVGSARFVASAQGFSKHYFSFEKSDQAHHVRRLEDLAGHLKPKDKTP
ncbi:MAG: hypothetical protein QNI88_05735 [Desulfobacterales bacterium]|nr:hypothetical protein [Desulfobacterales bacterium]